MSDFDEEREEQVPSVKCSGSATGSITLVQRALTRQEALCLHEELKTTPNIFGYTQEELLRFRDVLIAEVEGIFAGACLSKDLL